MSKHPTQTPSKRMERIKIRVLCDVPVWEECRPVIGKVYDAINGDRASKSRGMSGEFCVIDVNGKKVVLRNKNGCDSEYEVVADGRT